MTFGRNKKVKTGLPDAQDKKFKSSKGVFDSDIKNPFDDPMKIMDAFDDFEQNDFGKPTVKGIFSGIQGVDEVKPKTKNLLPQAKKGKKKFDKDTKGMDIFGGIDTEFDIDTDDPFKL